MNERVHGESEDREHPVRTVHGTRSRSLGGMFTPFTGLAYAVGVSVHTGVCAYKAHTREHTLEPVHANIEVLLSAFPGSEVVLDAPVETLGLDAQADQVARWNDWQRVLEADQATHERDAGN